MKRYTGLFGALIVSISLLVSCKKEEINYSIPTSYEFKNSNGVSTVDFSGQKIRLAMLDQLSALMGGVNPVTEVTLWTMYNGTGFSDNSLNTSGKKLSDKTAASVDYFSGINPEQETIINKFKDLFKDAELLTHGSELANAGVAGSYIDGTKKRYFSSNGLEPQQVFAKGMMGACLLDQVLNNYLSTKKLDAGSNKTDNTNKVLVVGKTYTEMEHSWDEAFGYIYGYDNLISNPPVFKFWSSYINQVNADPNFSTVKNAIFQAFVKGRAAITNADYNTRDAQVSIIKKELSKVPALRAVYYLVGEGKVKLATNDGKAAFHALSEAYGFIWCLRFTQNPSTNLPYFTTEEVNGLLDELVQGQNGLYDVIYLKTALDKIANKIAVRFGFTVDQAKDPTN